MDRFDKTDCFFGGMLIGILLLWGAIMLFDDNVPRSTLQLEQEAIAHGFADYLIDTNKNVTFQWKK
jgi:hypothetical protein